MSAVVATPRVRVRQTVRISDFVEKAKAIAAEIPAWFWVAPAIAFFVSAASFSTGGF